jgi:hypothetical protein
LGLLVASFAFLFLPKKNLPKKKLGCYLFIELFIIVCLFLTNIVQLVVA